MKKQFLFLVAIVTAFVSMAQTTPLVGIRGGLSVAGMRGNAVSSLKSLIDFTDGAITTTNRTGLFAGTYVTIPVSDKIALEPALYYAQKGYALNGDFSVKSVDFLNASATAQLNAHYIDLPVVLKASIGGFQVFAGPQVSYLAKANLKTTAGVLGINLLHKNLNATDQFNRWDAGLTGGIGYQFSNGMNIMAAYDRGLSKADAGKSTETYNQSYKVGIGFSF